VAVEGLRRRRRRPRAAASAPRVAVAGAGGGRLGAELCRGSRAGAAHGARRRRDRAGHRRRRGALLRGDTLRAYETDDIAGVETGGAVKNVLAIAAGASDGLGFGHNARAALITRGLAETARLAVALGGRRETMMGSRASVTSCSPAPATCRAIRRVGLALAKGRKLDEILAELGHVAEVCTRRRAARHARVRHGVTCPIAEAVDRALYETCPCAMPSRSSCGANRGPRRTETGVRPQFPRDSK